MDKKNWNIFLIMLTFINLGCGSFTGINESIDFYTFECSTKNLISAIDKFLIKNKNYYEGIDETWGTIYINIPETGQKFGFRIGGYSEIRLMMAGDKNKEMKFGEKLYSFQKKKFSKNFDTYFLRKLKIIKSKESNILVKPFMLTSNNPPEFNSWYNNYILRIDTLLRYPLPKEIDSLGINYFENLILDYCEYSRKKINKYNYVSQFHHLFAIDNHYTGYIENNFIYITAFYRTVGESYIFSPPFEEENWNQYLTNVSKDQRINNYKNRRMKRKKNGRTKSRESQEYWMLPLLPDSLQ